MSFEQAIMTLFALVLRNVSDIEGAYVVKRTYAISVQIENEDFSKYVEQKRKYIEKCCQSGEDGSTNRLYVVKLGKDGTLPDQDKNEVEDFEYPNGSCGKWTGPMPGEVKLLSKIDFYPPTYDNREPLWRWNNRDS